MARFPKLKTGAAAQYPTRASVDLGTHTTRFLDGAEQRFATRSGVIRRWELELSHLSEDEVREIRTFFVAMKGSAGVFEFEDPLTGLVHAGCRFDSDWIEWDAIEIGDTRTKIRIRTV